ncbi:MAG: OB-fold nucleic acid binding domain-containing protein, partial [bacterium]
MLEEELVRRTKLQKLRDKAQNPYPSDPKRNHTVKQVLTDFEHLMAAKTTLQIVGRVKTKRKHGAITFLNLEDESGSMQVALRRDGVGDEAYQNFEELIDPGDFLEIKGVAFLTKRGEPTLDAEFFRVLTKALLPLPEKW